LTLKFANIPSKTLKCFQAIINALALHKIVYFGGCACQHVEIWRVYKLLLYFIMYWNWLKILQGFWRRTCPRGWSKRRTSWRTQNSPADRCPKKTSADASSSWWGKVKRINS